MLPNNTRTASQLPCTSFTVTVHELHSYRARSAGHLQLCTVCVIRNDTALRAGRVLLVPPPLEALQPLLWAHQP
jgi:hypothetical protein